MFGDVLKTNTLVDNDKFDALFGPTQPTDNAIDFSVFAAVFDNDALRLSFFPEQGSAFSRGFSKKTAPPAPVEKRQSVNMRCHNRIIEALGDV